MAYGQISGAGRRSEIHHPYIDFSKQISQFTMESAQINPIRASNIPQRIDIHA